jgi:hypothetical protein
MESGSILSDLPTAHEPDCDGGVAATRFMGSFDLQQWTRIGAMNLPQWRVSVLDCASPLALSMTHDLQSGSGLPHSKTWRSCQRFMGRASV